MNEAVGYVDLELDGTKYRLQLSFEAMLRLEEHGLRFVGKDGEAVRKNYQKLAEWFSDVTLQRLQVLFWAVLAESHPEITFKQAGGLIFTHRWQRVAPGVMDAYALAFGRETEEATPDPPIPASTGSTSGPSPAMTSDSQSVSSGA